MKQKTDKKITLFSEKENCCGCGACLNACPKQAISMKEDKYGFIFPHIDSNLCIKCGLCQKVCAYQNVEEKHTPLKTWAVSAKNRKTLEKSASGGAFFTLAYHIISEGGVVFGAVFNSDWSVSHFMAEKISDLKKLQGSKYVQSSTGNCYRLAEECLKKGTKVLYSGTPCQIAGLYGYLGRDYENLTTIDIICHGVPNNHMFQEYLKSLGNVTDFRFRDKKLGWGINGTAVVNGKKIKIWQSASPYLYYFAHGMIYRDSCYICKYADSHRPADITLGDYWGIEKHHPEYLKKGVLDSSMGISVVIANSEKGIKLIQKYKNSMNLFDSDFSKVSESNTQLRKPTAKSIQRDEIMKLYHKHGWTAVSERFFKKIGLRKYSSQIKSLIPTSVKNVLKRR